MIEIWVNVYKNRNRKRLRATVVEAVTNWTMLLTFATKGSTVETSVCYVCKMLT